MRRYYHHRMGSTERASFNLHEVIQEVLETFKDLDEQGYFQRSFGYDCVDSGRTPGLLGAMDRYFYRETGIRMERGPFAFITEADETRIFVIIEFLHEHAAAPDPEQRWGAYRHDFSNCGWHFDPKKHPFDVVAGRREWRNKINNIIDLYDDGYELSEQGEIVRLAPDGMKDLVAAAPTAAAGESNVAKINHAVHTFRRGLSSREEQKQAIRDLADVLEFYRPQVKTELLKEDERDLFLIANQYAIRHHRANQKDGYDGPWLTWLFYLYLSSVHLVLALVHQVPMAAAPALPPAPPPAGDEGGPRPG
jgi:hypothetical protein